jgi:hypothetical protein
METTLDATVRDDLREQLTKLEAATETLRSHRNKRIAHLDLNTAVKLEPLPSVVYGDVEYALRFLESIMEDLYPVVREENGSVHYRAQFIPLGCDGDHLLRVLRKAHDHRESKE